MILNHETYRSWIEKMNDEDVFEGDTEIRNIVAWDYLKNHMPLLDCPDSELMLTWYFRWWMLRKHIIQTPEGRLITEFLPKVNWAGKYNTIVMAASLHILEARWLRSETVCDDYLRFWFSGVEHVRDYSNFLPAAALDLAKVHGSFENILNLAEAMEQDQARWEQGFTCPISFYGPIDGVGKRKNGLFFTVDDLNGSEISVSGNGYTSYLNACMYGRYKALEQIFLLCGNDNKATQFHKKAVALKEAVQEKLWNQKRNFFCTLHEDGTLSDARELYGYVFWLFDMPDEAYETCWSALTDLDGFEGTAAIPFLELGHPDFKIDMTGHMCKWNGPSWPLATSLMLKSMIQLLQRKAACDKDKKLFFRLLRQYAANQRMVLANGKIVPWIDENQNPFTGAWTAHDIRCLKNPSDYTGKDYNHSLMNDLIITGLLGLMPSLQGKTEIHPLLPEGAWPWFCLDYIPYHKHLLTVVYDKDGSHYGLDSGLQVFADGNLIFKGPDLTGGELNI